MHRFVVFLTAALAFAAIPFLFGLVLSPTRAIADVTVALDGLPQSGEEVPMIPVWSGAPPTVTLTNLRTGSTHSDRMDPAGRARIQDVPPGYYQVRIRGATQYHIDYIKVDAKGNAQLRYNWQDMYFRFGWMGLSDAEYISAMRDRIIEGTQTNDQEWRDQFIGDLSKIQEIHRQALKSLESLGPKAIRTVGPPRFNTWRLLHHDTLRDIDTAFDQAARAPANAGTGSTNERRAELKEQQSQLMRQHQSQTAEIAVFTPKFLERRQYLLERLPPTLRTNLTRAGNTDPASYAAVSRTQQQIQIELQDAANQNATAPADLARLKILYEQMEGYYSALFGIEIGIAVFQKEITKIVEDKKTFEEKKSYSTDDTGIAAGDRGN